MAFGTAYIDDGISFPPGPSRSLTFQASDGMLEIESNGEYEIQQKLETITVLGVQKPAQVTLRGQTMQGWTYKEGTEELVVSDASIDLNGQVTLAWTYCPTLSEVVMGSGRASLAVGAERRLLCERSTDGGTR